VSPKTAATSGTVTPLERAVVAEHKIYNRAYKTHFARIKYKRMTKEQFKEWAEEARERRDMVTRGALTLEQYELWVKH